MGLLKVIERDDDGVLLGYWHLSGRQDHFDAGRIDVTLHGYTSEAAYRAGKRAASAPLRYALVTADFPDGTDLHGVTTAMLYAAVRAKAATAAAMPRDGNKARLPEVNGTPADPALAGAVDSDA